METFKDEQMLEPLDLYKTQLKDAFHNNAENFFDELDKKANVDVNKNQTACSTYYKEKANVEKFAKKNTGLNVARVFALIFFIVMLVMGIVFIINGEKLFGNKTTGIVVPIILFVVAIGLLVLFIYLCKRIKSIKKVINDHQAKADTALAEAYETMKPLNNLLEWNMAANLFTKTTPLIQMDQVFDGKKYELLHDKFGYEDNNSTDTSAVYVQSGSILGNPFIFEKNYCQTMRMHHYVGTLVITYTTRVSDGNGGTRSQTVTQTLTAHLDKPEPAYYLDTTLIYGNDAAPKLMFSRRPTGINKMNEKQIQKYVEGFDKKLDKKASKAVKTGDSFTRLANEEFEALFNALDRNNEMEFRLLFTPLAQRNMIKLLKSKEDAFGDDFAFIKKQKLNYVTCDHMQYSDVLDRSPDSLKNFDYKVAKQTFVDYADKYLKDVFFNLAPVISIPLYQQHKTIDYIYKGTFKHNVTQAEAESAANGHDINLFKHPATRSEGVILKSRFDRLEGDADVCTITAHSFSGTDRVTYVPTMGGDGKFHDVPVHWVEYNPISQETPFVVSDTKTDLNTYRENYQNGKFNDIINKFSGSNDMLYKKRLFSFVLKDNK